VIRIRSFIRINGQIRAKLVRTIDKDGKQAGVLPIDSALALARSSGLDLVEVAPTIDPPVCKVMDFGKYQYQQMKKDRMARKKQVGGKLKEIKLRPRIEVHDYNVKLRQSREFLAKGCKLRIRLVYRGRELAHVELGNNLLKRLREDLADVGHVEVPAKQFGKNVVMMFGPQKGGKAHPAGEQKKGVGDAKAEDKPLGGEAVQNNEAREG
jgi:translation initiation factor IF-3